MTASRYCRLHRQRKQRFLGIITEISVTALTSLPYGAYTFYHVLQHIQR
jgi:hypothetical protein